MNLWSSQPGGGAESAKAWRAVPSSSSGTVTCLKGFHDVALIPTKMNFHLRDVKIRGYESVYFIHQTWLIIVRVSVQVPGCGIPHFPRSPARPRPVDPPTARPKAVMNSPGFEKEEETDRLRLECDMFDIKPSPKFNNG